MPAEHGTSAPIGVLASGGLDSCILLADMLRQGRTVQPFYVETGLVWQQEELRGLNGFLAAIAQPRLLPLVLFKMPLDDIYQNHWSLTGRNVPDADSPDEAVFLPGRNSLLLVKAAVWCQLHGITQLALAPLGTSPFEDASAQFISDFQGAMNRGSFSRVEFLLPFAGMNKRQVMRLGADLPLDLTFSCMAPLAGQHCGHCNKCAERQAAFREGEYEDRTRYAAY